MSDTKVISVRLVGDRSGLQQTLGAGANDVKNFERSVQQAGATVGSTTAKMNASWGQAAQTAGQLGRQMTVGITLPVVAAGVAATKMSNDFEQSFSRMVGLAGVSRDEIAGLKDEVLKLATDTGRAPQELADGLYFIESAGLHGSTALDALTVSAKAAEAGMGDTASVADALTGIISTYGAANISAARAGDILAAAVKDGKAEAAAMIPEFGRLLAPATALKVPFNDLAGALAYLTRSMPPDQAGTSLAGILRSLLNPSQQATQALDNVGISVADLQKSVAEKGLLPTMQMLQEKLGGTAIGMSQVFEDSRALNGALAILTNGGKDAAQVLDDTANSANDLELAVGAVSGDEATKARKAMAEIQVALIKVGEAIAPLVTDIVSFGATVLTIFTSLPTPVQNTLLGFAALLAVVGPLGIAWSRLYTVGQLVNNGIGLLRSGIDGLIASHTRSAEVAAADSLAMSGYATAEGEAAAAAGGLVVAQQAVTDEMVAAALAEGEAALAAQGLAVAEGEAAVASTELATASAAAGVGVAAALGPIGVFALAAGGLVAALSLVGGAEHNAAVDSADYTQALKDQNGVLSDNIDKVSAHALSQDGAARAASTAGVSWKAMFESIRAGTEDYSRLREQVESLGAKEGLAGEGTSEFTRQLIAAADAGTLTKDQVIGLLSTMEGLHNKYVDNKAATDAETDALNKQGTASWGAKLAMGGLADQTDANTTSADALQDAQGGLVKTIDDLAAGMDRQYQSMLAPMAASDDFKSNVNALIDSLHSEGFALDAASDGTGKYNEHALKNDAAIRQLGGSIAHLIEQRFAETHSVDAAVASGEMYVQNLTDQLHAAGYTDDQVQQLISTMHLTPDEIRTEFSTNAIEQQLTIGKYLATLTTIPPSKRTDIEAAIKEGEYQKAEMLMAALTAPRTAVVHVGVDYVDTNRPPGVPQRWGGIVHAYAAGGLEAHVARDQVIRYAEPETGGEAFVPRLGNRDRSVGVLDVAARWYGMKVVPFDVGGIIASTQSHSAAVSSARGMLGDSAAGQFNAAAIGAGGADLQQQMEQQARDLDRMAEAYAHVAEVAGQSAADQLAAANLTADEFTSAATEIVNQTVAEGKALKKSADEQKRDAEEVAKAHMAAHDVMFRTGNMDTASYLAILQQRLAGTAQFSSEWEALWNQINQINADVAKEHEAIHDRMYREGQTSTADYLAMLNKRLAGTVQFSADWDQLWGQINSINSDVAKQHMAVHDVMFRVGKLGTAEYLDMLRQRLAKTEEFSPEWEQVWNEIARVQDDAAQKADDANKKLIDSTTTTADEFNTAIDSMTRTLFGAFDATTSFYEQLQKLTDTVHDNAGSLDVLTDVGRADRSAISSAAQAAISEAEAVYAQTGDLAKASQDLQHGLDSIKATLAAQGVGAADIDKLFSDLGVTDQLAQSLLGLPHGGDGTVVQGNQTNVNTYVTVDMTGATIDSGVYEQLHKEFPGLVERSVKNAARANA